jgi:microcystin-dependent protein
MKIKYIILGLVILLIILFLVQKKEHITQSSSTKNLSTEAIQNIANIYADTKNTATFNNINITAWKGMITMWSGDVTKIPKGWALCDGKNDRPDLRGRFILGYGKGDDLSDRKMGEKGGEETHILDVTEMPSHTHFLFVNKEGGTGTSDTLYPTVNVPNTYVYGTSNSESNTNRYKLNAGSTTPADAGISGYQGDSQPHNNMPPYYVLAYIIKT